MELSWVVTYMGVDIWWCGCVWVTHASLSKPNKLIGYIGLSFVTWWRDIYLHISREENTKIQVEKPKDEFVVSSCIVFVGGNHATDPLEVVGLLMEIKYDYISFWDTGLCPLFCNGSCTFLAMGGKSFNICELNILGGNLRSVFLYGLEWHKSLNGICNLSILPNNW